MSAALLRALSGPQLSSCQQLHAGSSSVTSNASLQGSSPEKSGAQSMQFPPSICGGEGDNSSMFTSRFSQQLERIAIKGKTQLNLEQRSAVAAMMCGAGRSGRPPFVLFGPPGDESCHLPINNKRALVVMHVPLHPCNTRHVMYAQQLLGSGA